ncbi:helix-turn-helix domain-containing protein [Gordonia rubripertincta]|uniref:Helix-turn-helix domain-containing protein n=1 Tax=Gordonia rubripertincta TaxID=36822 RepID=A0AAW4G874_GORRU|nr:helix-turn-helix domain-containing protein [Gordonia rubripertincta]MBM7279305.1 helix-turn-helix domain-containing protein [Gordonia rubripertincta]
MSIDEWLTPAEVAAELKINVRTIREWIRAGRLKAEQLGPRTTRIRRAALSEL